MASSIRVSLSQLNSQDNKAENLAQMLSHCQLAQERGTQLIAFPEMATFIGHGFKKEAEALVSGETFQALSEAAKTYQLWIHSGSIYEINPKDEKRPFNTTMLISPAGELVASYRKIHPFDVELDGKPIVKESNQISPGQEIITFNTDSVGHLGFSICYDLRFPELFRLMALKGANILLIPANFTLHTGKDHWEVLLRARAIENGCYVLAPAQWGVKPAFEAYGKSMIIDPWGNVIAKAQDRTELITADLDLKWLTHIRQQVMTLPNRRDDLYSLTKKD